MRISDWSSDVCSSDLSVPEVAHATSPAPGIISAGRLVPADIERLREAGIRHVIDLTPDEETPGFDEAATVRAAGLGYSNLPLAGPPDLTREHVLAFDALLRDAAPPVPVHCPRGTPVARKSVVLGKKGC